MLKNITNQQIEGLKELFAYSCITQYASKAGLCEGLLTLLPLYGQTRGEDMYCHFGVLGKI